jgi:hypothetical protein
MTGRIVHSLSLLVVALCLVVAPAAHAQQDFQSTIEQFGGTTITGYIQPVADMFGANINSGFFHTADIPKWGFHFKIEFVGMASLVEDAQKIYTASAPPGFNPSTFETATIFGEKGGLVVDQTTHFSSHGSDGLFNTKYFPFAAPQVTIGDVFGTRFLFRLILTPEFQDGKVPKVTLWGLGAQHSINQYLPMLPFDVAVHGVVSRLKFGDLVTANATSIGLDASTSWAVFTLYGGVAWETSSLSLAYQPDNALLAPVDLTLDGKQSFRGKLGVNIGLGPIALFADGNLGSVTVLSAGIGFGL